MLQPWAKKVIKKGEDCEFTSKTYEFLIGKPFACFKNHKAVWHQKNEEWLIKAWRKKIENLRMIHPDNMLALSVLSKAWLSLLLELWGRFPREQVSSSNTFFTLAKDFFEKIKNVHSNVSSNHR